MSIFGQIICECAIVIIILTKKFGNIITPSTLTRGFFKYTSVVMLIYEFNMAPTKLTPLNIHGVGEGRIVLDSLM